MPEKNIGIIAFSTDNRAYVLPHLMANYAYNQLNLLPVDSIFQIEKRKFDTSFDRENEIKYPNEADLLTNSPENDKIIGNYQNTSNWPKISIRNKQQRKLLHFELGSFRWKNI